MLNKVTLVSLVLFCGCSIIFGPSDVVRHPRDNTATQQYSYIPPAYDRYTYGNVKSYKVGQWVLYNITSKSNETSALKIAVVAKEGVNLWIEVISNNMQGISLRLVTPDGDVLKAFYAESGKTPTAQPLEHYISSEGEWPKRVSRQVGRGIIESPAGKFDAHIIETVTTEEDGRQTVETKYISGEIPPLYLDGFVMLKEKAVIKAQLISFGNDAKPTIQIPNQ